MSSSQSLPFFSSSSEIPVVAIVVNYNNWQDAALCVESLLACEPKPRWIVIVDNNSPNESLEALNQWALGKIELEYPLEKYVPLREKVHKPFSFYTVSDQELSDYQALSFAEKSVFLIKNSKNSGYSGGNNLGLRLGLHLNAKAFLLINSDTVVSKEACGALYDRLNTCARPGLVGGHIRYFFDPDITQCCSGGYTNRWTLLCKLVETGRPIEESSALTVKEVESQCNFIYGACIMASKEFVETVGLLDERFFLYCEEQDWAWSAARRFDLAFAPNAHIFHKEGASIHFLFGGRALPRLFQLFRSRLLLALKHAPYTLPTVCLGSLFASLRLTCRIIRNKRRATCYEKKI